MEAAREPENTGELGRSPLVWLALEPCTTRRAIETTGEATKVVLANERSYGTGHWISRTSDPVFAKGAVIGVGFHPPRCWNRRRWT